MYFPVLCHENVGKSKCLHPSFDPAKTTVQLKLYLTPSGNTHLIDFGEEIFHENQFDLTKNLEKLIEIKVPEKTMNNGSLWLHAFLVPSDSKTSKFFNS